MTKRELAEELARIRGVPPATATAVIDAFVRAVERALTDGDSVTLRSFGRFEVRRRSARSVRSPGTGRRVDVPARLVPAFRSAPSLQRRLNG